MNLKITPIDITKKVASVEYDGCTAPITLTFSARSKSDGKSIIATLPKALRDLGSATNLTLKAADFVLGATILRESVRGTAVRTHATKATNNPLMTGVGDDGSLEVYEVMPYGTKAIILSTSEEGVVKAFMAAKKINAYIATLTEFAVSKAKVFAKNAPAARASLVGMGYSDSDIDAFLAKRAPQMPKFKGFEIPLPAEETPSVSAPVEIAK